MAKKRVVKKKVRAKPKAKPRPKKKAKASPKKKAKFSVKKAVSTLTRECDCPAKFHKAQEYHGKRILKTTRRKP